MACDLESQIIGAQLIDDKCCMEFGSGNYGYVNLTIL